MLLECRFLIPLRSDVEISDGRIHASRTWRWLERELFDHFSGWSKPQNTLAGTWKSSKTGEAVNDVSVEYVVAVAKGKLKKLRSILQRACVRFAQQCIYLSVAGIVEFVEPQP